VGKYEIIIATIPKAAIPLKVTGNTRRPIKGIQKLNSIRNVVAKRSHTE